MSEAMSEAPSQSIETLKELPVQVTWTDEGFSGSLFGGGYQRVYGEFFSIDLQGQSSDELPFDLDVPASFNGSIDDVRNGDHLDKYLEAGQLDVSKGFRGNGLGKRLTQALAYIAAEQECKAIKVSFSHPASLQIFRKIYGDDRIHFTQKDEDDPRQEVPLDITVDQALELINREREAVMRHGVERGTGSGIFRHHPKTDDEIRPGAVDGVQAWIDIEGFDISGIEPPIQQGVLPGTSDMVMDI
jgi:GNAT superfamily N-acetyltransferase